MITLQIYYVVEAYDMLLLHGVGRQVARYEAAENPSQPWPPTNLITFSCAESLVEREK